MGTLITCPSCQPLEPRFQTVRTAAATASASTVVPGPTASVAVPTGGVGSAAQPPPDHREPPPDWAGGVGQQSEESVRTHRPDGGEAFRSRQAQRLGHPPRPSVIQGGSGPRLVPEGLATVSRHDSPSPVASMAVTDTVPRRSDAGRVGPKSAQLAPLGANRPTTPACSQRAPTTGSTPS